MSYYIAGMFLIPLLDWLDRLYDRHAVRIRPEDCIPDKVFVFGICVDVRVNGMRRDLRFIRIKLPIWSWGPMFPFMSYGFKQHCLYWIEGNEKFSGLRLDPPLGG